jgi:hypothetical protein
MDPFQCILAAIDRRGYVVFGKRSNFAPTLDLATLNGASGFKITGVTVGDDTGASVSAAGDVNGDGLLM